VQRRGLHRGFYTQDDFKALVKYATDRFIEIVPELEGPAHATAAIRSLGGVAVMGLPGPDSDRPVLHQPERPGQRARLAFWRDAIAQLAAISPAPIVHIGGDEAIGMPTRITSGTSGRWRSSSTTTASG